MVENMDPAELLAAYHNPDKNRGWIEDIITRARAQGIDQSRLIPREVVAEFERRPMG
ncbi:MAG: hypothetical protein U9P14_12210 [Gemmatimonadota bacterium]|nr:hypothetical protein [Gemmatimonadota bacterium]